MRQPEPPHRLNERSRLTHHEYLVAEVSDRGGDLDRVELGSADLQRMRVDKYLQRRIPSAIEIRSGQQAVKVSPDGARRQIAGRSAARGGDPSASTGRSPGTRAAARRYRGKRRDRPPRSERRREPRPRQEPQPRRELPPRQEPQLRREP